MGTLPHFLDMARTHLKAALGLIFLSSSFLNGAAYQIYTQSANSLGYAHADMAALADDASTAWYNPAGMVNLCSPEVCIGGASFWIKEEFNGKVGVSSLPDLLAYEDGIVTTIPGMALQQPFRVPRAVSNTYPLFPSFNAVWPVHYYNLHFALGLAIDVPWGLETDYSYSSVRPYAAQTLIESLQINPSVAFGIGDLSFAVGYGREMLETKITSSVINTGAYLRLRGWENTYNLAVMYKFDRELTLGATFRPGLTHKISGNSSIFFSDGHATCHFKTPAVLTAGFKCDMSKRLSILGTVGYNLWSRVKSIEVDTGIPQVVVTPLFSNILAELIPSFLPIPPGADVSLQNILTLNSGKASIPIHGKDTVFLALGSKFIASDMWILKAGFGYDQSPIRPGTREFRIPDNDHYLFSVGARCIFNELAFADFGLEYIYTPKCGIKNNPILPVSIVPPELIITVGDVTEVIPLDSVVTVPPSQQGYTGSINSTALAFSLQIGIIFP